MRLSLEQIKKIQEKKIINANRLRRHNSNDSFSKPKVLKANFSKLASPNNFHKLVHCNFKDSVDLELDVSVIVPLYTSDKVIQKQIESWTSIDDNISKEIIYVDDLCPNKSYSKVIESWNKKENSENIKVIKNSSNCGYGKACNIGSLYARGKYLIFLNADCELTKNWIKPMIDAFSSASDVGIVGNKQIRKGNLDSAGSEWSWKTKSFLHIGRNSYHQKMIMRPFGEKDIPSDIDTLEKREMVTGCCFAILHNLFYDLEGFDEKFLIGYWEDSDLCLKVRSEGYEIMYQPNSVITHESGHSRSGGHRFMQHNINHFSSRWIETGRIDKLVASKRNNPPHGDIKKNIDGKVVGCIIACNEEEFLQPSIESLSSVVDEWIIVVGGNEYAYKAKMCDDRGFPNDSTMEIAYSMVDKFGGKVIPPPNRLWKDKAEMRRSYCDFLNPGDWMWLMDGDEVYKPNQIWEVTNLMKKYECLYLNHWTFWNNINTQATGYWDNFAAERVVKWREGYGYDGANHLFVTHKGQMIKNLVPTCISEDRLFYHYSWTRPIEKIIQKQEYYKYQTGNYKNNYVDEVFLKWREDPHSIKETHPFGQGGWKKFKGLHPKQIQDRINLGLYNF